MHWHVCRFYSSHFNVLFVLALATQITPHCVAVLSFRVSDANESACACARVHPHLLVGAAETVLMARHNMATRANMVERLL